MTESPLEAARKLAPQIRASADEIDRLRELPRALFEARADAVARVVDEHVDPPELAERLRHGLVHLRGVADVAGHRERAPPLRAHLRGHGIEHGASAAARHHVGADPRQLERDGAPDALAGAGHDGDAIAKRVGGKGVLQNVARGTTIGRPEQLS